MRRPVRRLAFASTLALSLVASACAGDGPTVYDVGAKRDSQPRDVPVTAPDTARDTTTTPRDSGGSKPGSPCPCTGGLVCALGACRTPCTSAPCNAGGPCAASETCVAVGGIGDVCMPGVAEGQACNVTDKLCVTGTLCLTLGGLGDRCWRSCTSSPCSGAYPKCWDIPNTTCKYCGPN